MEQLLWKGLNLSVKHFDVLSGGSALQPLPSWSTLPRGPEQLRLTPAQLLLLKAAEELNGMESTCCNQEDPTG